MPDRFLRKEILQSAKFNECSEAAQCFFYRLISVVDDYGCFDGRPAVITSAAYPLGRTDAPPLEELQKAWLLARYTNAGKPFIALMQWGESRRGARRFPAPPICNEALGINYQGVYGRKIIWRDPPGYDPVSILLDPHGRQVAPQPPEWRDVHNGFAPLFLINNTPQALIPSPTDAQVERKPYGQGSISLGAQALNAKAGVQAQGAQQRTTNTVTTNTEAVGAAAVEPQALQASPTTATPPANGEIKLENGEWRGLGEAQRLRWQDMLGAGVSVPDALAKAAAHLEAHPEARAACESGKDTYHAFIVRWLLREARPRGAAS